MALLPRPRYFTGHKARILHHRPRGGNKRRSSSPRNLTITAMRHEHEHHEHAGHHGHHGHPAPARDREEPPAEPGYPEHPELPHAAGELRGSEASPTHPPQYGHGTHGHGHGAHDAHAGHGGHDKHAGHNVEMFR